MKAVLCSPPNFRQHVRHAESLGIRYLAAAARNAGHDVDVIDAHCWGWDIAKTVSAIVDSRPSLLGLQIIFHEQVSPALQIARDVVNTLPTVQVIAGGHVPTFSAENLLRKFSFLSGVVRGEAELSFVQMLDKSRFEKDFASILLTTPGAAVLRDGIYRQQEQAPLIHHLDDLPFPLRYELDFPESKLASIIGSRGCYARCNFCSVPQFFMEANGPLWRLRSAKSMVDEIEDLQSNHGITHISFLDDIFLAKDRRSRARALELAQLIFDRTLDIKFSIECRADAVDRDLFSNLARAGLSRVFIGIEAGDDATLKRYNKGITADQNRNAIGILRELGITIGLGFILFHPDISIEELKNNINFLRTMQLVTKRSLCGHVDAYPGTPVWARLKKAGRLFGDELSPRYSFSNPLVEQMHSAFRSFFAPLHVIDILILRAEFQLTAFSGRWRVDGKHKLQMLRNQYSEDLCQLALRLIDIIRSSGAWVDSDGTGAVRTQVEFLKILYEGELKTLLTDFQPPS